MNMFSKWKNGQILNPKNNQQPTDDNMVPLINIVFLLLIFFMVAGQIKAQPDSAIKLPESKALDAAQGITVRLELLKDGKVQFKGELLQAEQLKDVLPVGQNTSIALFADGRATAQHLDTLISHIPSSNNTDIRLFTMEKQ